MASTALVAAMAVAAPASAGTNIQYCGSGVAVEGGTQSGLVCTMTAGISAGDCGGLGVRGNYVHVGGDSWTPWEYRRDRVSISVNNAVRAMHSTEVQNLLFSSFR